MNLTTSKAVIILTNIETTNSNPSFSDFISTLLSPSDRNIKFSFVFNMLNYDSKKISATFVSSALAIFSKVSVVVVVIVPFSNPEIIVLDTPLFSANSHCDIFFSFLHSLILYPIFHSLPFCSSC